MNHPGGSLSPHARLAHLGPASSSHTAALTGRHHATRTSRVALASRIKRSPSQARRAEAHEIASVQLIERTQQMVLVRQPSLAFGDDGSAVAVAADPERIAPFAAARCRPRLPECPRDAC